MPHNNVLIGLIRLSELPAEWSEKQAVNPRLLAAELAGVLRSISKKDQLIEPHNGRVHVFDPSHGQPHVSYHALAEYFDQVAQGRTAQQIHSTKGAISTNSYGLRRAWVEQLTAEAEKRSIIASGLLSHAQIPHRDFLGNALKAPEPPISVSGSDPQALSVRQKEQRAEGEQSASEQLEKAKQLADTLDKHCVRLTAQLDSEKAKTQQALNAASQHQAKANEAIRNQILLEEKLRDLQDEARALEDRAREAETLLEEVPIKIAQDFKHLAPIVSRLDKLLVVAGPQKKEKREEKKNLYLLIIAGLLKLLLDRKRPQHSQGTASDAISSRGWYGVKKRQVDGVFAAANRAETEASLEANE